MLSRIEEQSHKRKVEKFSSKVKSILDTIDISLKKELEPKFTNDPSITVDCYIENVDAFAVSPNKTVFSRDFGQKYGFSMPMFDKKTTEINKYNVQLTMSWAYEHNCLVDYVNTVMGSCDFTIYLKFLELGNSPKFNEMIYKDYGINLNDEEYKKFFRYIREDIRNANVHLNATTFEHYSSDSIMLRDLDYLVKFSKIFFKSKNHENALIKLEKEYKEASEIIKSKPIPLDDLLDDYPVFGGESDLIATFDIDYDAKNHYLYANSVGMIEKMINGNYPGASMELKNLPTERQLLTCFCIDTSISMMKTMNAINNGIKTFVEMHSKNKPISEVLNFCIVTFGNIEPKVVQRFNNINKIETPKLVANGRRNMADGVDLAIDETIKKANKFMDKNIPIYVPQLFIISGGSSEEDLSALKRKIGFLNGKTSNAFEVTCIGYGVENNEKAKQDLQVLSTTGEILLVDSTELEEIIGNLYIYDKE